MATRGVALVQLAARADAGERDSSGAPRRRAPPSFVVRSKHLRARVTAAPVGAYPAEFYLFSARECDVRRVTPRVTRAAADSVVLAVAFVRIVETHAPPPPRALPAQAAAG